MFGPADKKLGFGFMRLPMKGEEVDIETTCRMVDEFLAAGFCYFDTAHGYHDGQSEAALKAALTSRYPREKYILADKLSPPFFEKEADIRPLFKKQLEACGVEYFDMYLMHAQSAGRFEFYKSCRAYETAFALKAEGRVRHVGISFHDTAVMWEFPSTTPPRCWSVSSPSIPSWTSCSCSSIIWTTRTPRCRAAPATRSAAATKSRWW